MLFRMEFFLLYGQQVQNTLKSQNKETQMIYWLSLGEGNS